MSWCQAVTERIFRVFSILVFGFLFAAPPAIGQSGTLNVNRVVLDWPDVHVYYTPRCAGVTQYGISQAQVSVSVDGIPRSVFSHSCPSTPCVLSTALVGDASGSMAGAGNAAMRGAYHSFIDALTSQDETAVLHFNTTVTTEQAMTADTALLHAAVDAIPASGGTAFWDGVWAGIQEVINNGSGSCRSVIAITDGNDNYSTRTPSEIIDLAAREQVHLFPIALGSAVDTITLSLLADLTGGRCRNVQDSAQLHAVIIEFLQYIRAGFEECAFTTQPGCADGAVHSLRMEISGLCGGTFSDSATYRAPLDTASFTDMQLQLSDTLVTGETEFNLPLKLMTDPGGERFEPMRFSIAFNPTHLELKDIFPSPSSLLGPVQVSFVRTVRGADVEVGGPTVISGTGPLLDFRFRSIVIPQDTICTPVEIVDADFDAGCFRAVFDNAEICIRGGTPAVSCEMTGQDAMLWDKGAQRYAPHPFAVSMNVRNVGDGGATGLRFHLDYDTTDVLLVSPLSNEIIANPSLLLPGGESLATWQLAARPRSSADSITLRISASFDNAPTTTCSHQVFVPAADLTLQCAVDAPAIDVDGPNMRYQPMPFPVTLTVHNPENDTIRDVRARIVLPAQFTLAGPDAPDRFLKDVLPIDIAPKSSGALIWMLSHPLTSQERGYLIDVWVYASNADSTLCQAVVTIPAIDAPQLAPRCHAPDSLHFDLTLDAYVPNPFTVKLTCVNNGQLPAAKVNGTLILPLDVELVDPSEPLTKSFNPSTIGPWSIGDPIPELTWMVRYSKRAHMKVCPEFRFRVTGENSTGIPLDTVTVACCVPVLPVLPQWVCAMDFPDSLGINAAGTSVEPNPFTVRYTITNTGQRAGVIRRMQFPLPLQDGLSLNPASPMGLDDTLDVTIGPNATASFEWIVDVQNRIARRDLMLEVTAWDDAGDPVRCEHNLPIAAVEQQLVCSDLHAPKEICGEGGRFFVTAILRNAGTVNINNPEVLLEWRCGNGVPLVAFDNAWPDNNNPKSRGVIFPQQELEYRWYFRTLRMNTDSIPLQVHFSIRYGAANIPEQSGGANCEGTVTLLPLQHHPIDIIGSLPPCEGDTVILDAGGGYMHYRWNEGLDTLRQLIVTQSGEYSVRRYLATDPHCMVISDTVRISFNPRPAIPVITRSGNTLTAPPAAAWKWLRNQGVIPGATGQSYTVTQNGSYAVIVSNSFGCSAMSDTVSVIVLSAEDPPTPRLQLSVYPNPLRDVFTVDIRDGRAQQLRLSVTDLLGREAYTRTVMHSGGHAVHRVDLTAQSPGIYFLHVDGVDQRHGRVLHLQRE